MGNKTEKSSCRGGGGEKGAKKKKGAWGRLGLKHQLFIVVLGWRSLLTKEGTLGKEKKVGWARKARVKRKEESVVRERGSHKQSWIRLAGGRSKGARKPLESDSGRDNSSPARQLPTPLLSVTTGG